MEWGNDLFMLAALALCVLPLIKLLSESLSGSGNLVQSWHYLAKLAGIIALVTILMLAWVNFMIETFTPSL